VRGETWTSLNRSAGHASAVGFLDALDASPRLTLQAGGLEAAVAWSDANAIGGAVYDALVGAAAREHGLQLLSADSRAKSTYGALVVQLILVL
jgi:predicted nucleic acid-binding protein